MDNLSLKTLLDFETNIWLLNHSHNYQPLNM